MKKKCIMALIIGAAFLAQGCGYEEGTDAVVTVVDSTPTPEPTEKPKATATPTPKAAADSTADGAAAAADSTTAGAADPAAQTADLLRIRRLRQHNPAGRSSGSRYYRRSSTVEHRLQALTRSGKS